MRLIEGRKDGVYEITSVHLGEEIPHNRLSEMGVKAGILVKVLSKKEKGGLIIQFSNKQVALCRCFASEIDVVEADA